MDIWLTPSQDKNPAGGKDKDSSSIQKTLADVFLGSWLLVTVTEKELLPEVNRIVLGARPSSV